MGLRKYTEIIVEKFPDIRKKIVIQVQEVQRGPYRINPRRNMLRHNNQTNKNKIQRKNIKISKGRTTNNIQGSKRKYKRNEKIF